jgi:O-antigen/teichoic acid export membrane protein
LSRSLLVRVRRALVAILCGQVVTSGANLLLVPLFLSHWSVTAYGEWLALFSLASYLSTLDFGANTAALNRLTQAYARGDLKEYAECQHSTFAFFLAVAVTGAAALAAFTHFLPLSGWLGLRVTPPADAFWVVVLLGMQVLFIMPLGFFGNVYRTTGDMATSQWIGNGYRLAIAASAALTLICSGGPRAVAAAQLVPLVIMPALVYVQIRRRLAPLTPGLSHAQMKTVRSLFKPGLLFFLIMGAQALIQQGSAILVSSMLGGIAVAVFVTSRTLANLIRQAAESLNHAFRPDLTAMEIRGEHQRLRELHRLLVVGSATVCIAVAAALWFEGGEVLTVWTRGKLQPDVVLLRLLLVQLVLASPWLASSGFTAAANRHSKLSRSYLAAALLGLAVCAALIGRLGAWAVPVGLMCGEAIACYHFVVKDACEMMQERYRPFARRLWSGLAVVAAVSLASGWLAHRLARGPAVLCWAEVGVATSIASFLAAWWCWLEPPLRAAIVDRMRSTRSRGELRAVLLGW